MNKNIKILFFIVVIVILTPLSYKQYINNIVVKKIADLNNQGLMITQQKDNSTFLTTSKVYKIVVSNPSTLYKNFLSQFFNNSQKDMVKKILNSTNGSEITIDLNILNFPVTHKNAIGIYLTSLPPKIVSSSKPNPSLEQVKLFLKNKGFGIIVNANAFGKIKSITLKNIDKKFDNKKDNIVIQIKDYVTNFSKINFQNYDYAFVTTNSLFNFDFNHSTSKYLNIGYKNLKYNTDRENFYNYTMSCSLKNFHFNSERYLKKQALKLDNIIISTKSALFADNVNYLFKYKVKDINFDVTSRYGKNITTNINNFLFSGSIKGLNKDILKDISEISYTNKYLFKQKYLQISQSILNNGLEFQINHFDADSIFINQGKQLISFGKISTKLKLNILKNNIDLSKRFNPILLIKYINIHAKINITKKDFNFIKSLDKRGKMGKFFKLAKKQGDNVIFDIGFSNGQLAINNQKI